MTTSRRMGLIAAGLLWALSGCSKHKPVLPPVVKLNPAPKKRYEIIVKVDSRGADITMQGRAQFNIRNLDCIPIDYTLAIGGIKPKVDQLYDFGFNGQGNNSYIGYLYSDIYSDKNYYNLGVCEWILTAINININIKNKELVQRISVDGDSVLDQRSVISDCPLPGVSKASTMDVCFSRDGEIGDGAGRLSSDTYRISIQSRRYLK